MKKELFVMEIEQTLKKSIYSVWKRIQPAFWLLFNSKDYLCTKSAISSGEIFRVNKLNITENFGSKYKVAGMNAASDYSHSQFHEIYQPHTQLSTSRVV